MSQQSTAPTDAAPATFTPPTHREILTILGGLMLGMFLAALDQTIVATSIRTIGDDLHGLSLQAWVTTAYLLTATISTPLYGKLSDIYGRKPLYMISISIFVVGSLLSGTADSMYQLAVVPRRAGPRRRRAHGAGHHDPRRPRRPPGARPLPGVLPRGVRHVVGARAGGRRVLRGRRHDPRGGGLALGLPHQRAHRDRRDPRHLARAAPAAAEARRPPDRLPGRAGPGGGPGPAAGGRRAGPHLGLGLHPVDRLLRDRRGRGGRVHPGRAVRQGGRDPPALPVPQPHVLGRRGRQHRHRPGHVRRPGDAPALPPDRQGPVAHRGRPDAHPVHARHHDRLDRRGSDDRPGPVATRSSR